MQCKNEREKARERAIASITEAKKQLCKIKKTKEQLYKALKKEEKLQQELEKEKQWRIEQEQEQNLVTLCIGSGVHSQMNKYVRFIKMT